MTIKSEMKLIGSNASPFVTRAKFALRLKSIDYEYVQEELTNKSELLLKANPCFEKVPILFHGNEQPICESLVMIEYLDEILPNVHTLLPSNPAERAQSRFLAYYADTLFCPWMKEYMLTPEGERKDELINLIIEGSKLLEDAFVKLSHGKAFFGGDDMGYLDIVFGCFLGWIKFYVVLFGFKVIDESRNPKLTEWGTRMWSHEVTKSVIASDEMHMNFFNMLLGKRLYQQLEIV